MIVDVAWYFILNGDHLSHDNHQRRIFISANAKVMPILKNRFTLEGFLCCSVLVFDIAFKLLDEMPQKKIKRDVITVHNHNRGGAPTLAPAKPAASPQPSWSNLSHIDLTIPTSIHTQSTTQFNKILIREKAPHASKTVQQPQTPLPTIGHFLLHARRWHLIGHDQSFPRYPYPTDYMDPRRPQRCFNCGDENHTARFCKKGGYVCFNCNEEGHIARNCRSHMRSLEKKVGSSRFIAGNATC